MPALFVYLIAVGLLLGGGYGALSWLTAPEPVKAVAMATAKPPPARHADDSEAATAEARHSKANSADAGKREVASKAEIDNSGEAKAASADKAASSDQPPSASPLPQPEPAAAASRQQAGAAQASGPAQDQQDRSAHAEIPQAATDQEANRHAGAPAEAPAQHEEEKQSVQAVSPGNAQTIAPNAPAAKTAKRPQVRQASRRSEKRPLETMTLRTIELPDGRRISQLVPYRGGNRYRDDGPAVTFGRDE